MSSDWSSVNAQSTSATATSAATSHHSTPTKPRLVSNRFTHQSVDEDFKTELTRHRYSDISFEDFLTCAFDVHPHELEALKTIVRQASVHSSPDYLSAKKSFAFFAEKEEPEMYKPFAKMSNMVLERHQNGRRIKALAFDGDTYVKSRFAQRKPDLVIVPENDGDTQLTMTNVEWHHMLCVLEFKKKLKKKDTEIKISAGTKRTRDEHEAGTVVDGNKRQPSGSTENVSINAEASSSGVPVQPVLKSGRSQGSSSATTWSLVSSVGGTAPAHPSERNLSRGRSGRGSKGKRISSKHRKPTVPFHGVDAPEMGSGRQSMGPPDAIMKEALVPEPVQLEDLTSEGHSAIRRTSAATSSTSQATHPTSNSAARGHPGAGNLGQLEVQLANYIAEVMSERSDRTFAFGATVQSTKLRLTYYSRSTYVISEEIDILEQPESFAVFLVLFSMQTGEPEKLGFNTDIKFCDPFDTKREEMKPLAVKLDAINGGDNFDLKSDTVLELGGCIHTEYCLMGRATAVYDVKRPEGCGVDLVLKLSWQTKGRRREDKAILMARDVDAEHSPEIYGVAVLTEKSPSSSLKTACTNPPSKPSDERELRIILMRKYKNIEDLEDDEFSAIIPQFVVYVHKLFSEKELLHRDISIFNMAYYEKDDHKIATLIDFDLATFPEDIQPQSEITVGSTPPQDNPQGEAAVPNIVHPRPEDRSGTTPFMAIETLDMKTPGYKHHLCHDLESIFYVVVWHGVGYRHKMNIYPTETNRFNKDRRQRDVLRGWRIGPWSAVMTVKVAFVNRPLDILRSIIHPLLAVVAADLVDVIRARDQASVSEDLDRFRLELQAKTQLNLQPGVQLPTPVVRDTNVAIFPKFAKAWGITGMNCGKSCCVA